MFHVAVRTGQGSAAAELSSVTAWSRFHFMFHLDFFFYLLVSPGFVKPAFTSGLFGEPKTHRFSLWLTWWSGNFCSVRLVLRRISEVSTPSCPRTEYVFIFSVSDRVWLSKHVLTCIIIHILLHINDKNSSCVSFLRVRVHPRPSEISNFDRPCRLKIWGHYVFSFSLSL